MSRALVSGTAVARSVFTCVQYRTGTGGTAAEL